MWLSNLILQTQANVWSTCRLWLLGSRRAIKEGKTEAVKAGFAELAQSLSGMKDPPGGSSVPAMPPVEPSRECEDMPVRDALCQQPDL